MTFSVASCPGGESCGYCFYFKKRHNLFFRVTYKPFRMTGSLTVGNPPPRRAKFASLIGLGTPPVQEGILVFVAHTTHLFLPTKCHNFFLGLPQNTFKITGELKVAIHHCLGFSRFSHLYCLGSSRFSIFQGD